MNHCFAYRDAPAETTARCKLIESFTHEWVVVAIDPGSDTPGFGWSIDPDKAIAERNAMDQCKLSSPDDRKSYCIIGSELGDTDP